MVCRLTWYLRGQIFAAMDIGGSGAGEVIGESCFHEIISWPPNEKLYRSTPPLVNTILDTQPASRRAIGGHGPP